jgi:hypothetical protein
VLEHPGRVRALLDLAVEAGAVEGEREPRGEILGEGDLVGRIRRALLGAGERQHAELLLARLQRHGDDRARVEVVEERHPRCRRALVQLREDARAPALEDGAHLLLGVVRGAAGAVGLDQRAPGRGDPAQLVRLVHDVDHAPVGEVDDHQLGDAPEGAVELRARGDVAADTPQEVEARAALGALGGRFARGRLEQLAPVLPTLEVADVAQERLDVDRLAVRVAHGAAVLAHPHRAAVAGQQSVVDRGRRVACLLELVQDALAVVRVQQAVVQVGLLAPLGRRVAGEVGDSRADVERLGAIAGGRHPGDEREAVEQRPVPRLGGLELRHA